MQVGTREMRAFEMWSWNGIMLRMILCFFILIFKQKRMIYWKEITQWTRTKRNKPQQQILKWRQTKQEKKNYE